MKRIILSTVLFLSGFSVFGWPEDCGNVNLHYTSAGWLWVTPYGSKVGIYNNDQNSHPVSIRFPWDSATEGEDLGNFYLGGNSDLYGTAVEPNFSTTDLTTARLFDGEYATALAGSSSPYAGKPYLRFQTYSFYEGNGWVGPYLWFSLADYPKSRVFMILARDGRVGGRWLEFDYTPPYGAPIAHYNNCGGYWDFVVGVLTEFTLGGGSGNSGNVYYRTTWRVRIDVVSGSDSITGSDPSDMIINGLDLVSRLDADPTALGVGHYFGGTSHLDGTALQFGMRGTVVNLPRQDSQFGFSSGSARIPLFLDPPYTTNSIPAITPFSVTPLN